jgi:3-hydroxyisobutyrate dehydrogenase-like beta-hydroxyacid dehydrogenase
MQVSVVGLGNMGHAMARNLLNAGFQVTVWNRTPGRADDLVAAGATRASDMAAIASAGIVITMVADDAALDAVMFHDRLIESITRGSVHISMSTISVMLAERLTVEHARRGSSLVCAPVMGRPDAAAAAKLFILAAGPGASLDRCQPAFDAMGQRTCRIGDHPPAAIVVKLSMNFLIASMIESLGEAMALVRKSGIDPRSYLDILTGTLFTAPVYKNYGGMIAEGRYRPAGFPLPLGLKDLLLALDAARAVNVPMPVASLVRDHLITALAHGYDDADWAALGAVAARNAGLS